MLIHKSHQFVPSFTLNLNFEYAQNPARKHFEKTNIRENGMMSWYIWIFITSESNILSQTEARLPTYVCEFFPGYGGHLQSPG